jgi:hypothetical protein
LLHVWGFELGEAVFNGCLVSFSCRFPACTCDCRTCHPTKCVVDNLVCALSQKIAGYALSDILDKGFREGLAYSLRHLVKYANVGNMLGHGSRKTPCQHFSSFCPARHLAIVGFPIFPKSLCIDVSAISQVTGSQECSVQSSQSQLREVFSHILDSGCGVIKEILASFRYQCRYPSRTLLYGAYLVTRFPCLFSVRK